MMFTQSIFHYSTFGNFMQLFYVNFNKNYYYQLFLTAYFKLSTVTYHNFSEIYVIQSIALFANNVYLSFLSLIFNSNSGKMPKFAFIG